MGGSSQAASPVMAGWPLPAPGPRPHAPGRRWKPRHAAPPRARPGAARALGSAPRCSAQHGGRPDRCMWLLLPHISCQPCTHARTQPTSTIHQPHSFAAHVCLWAKTKMHLGSDARRTCGSSGTPSSMRAPARLSPSVPAASSTLASDSGPASPRSSSTARMASSSAGAEAATPASRGRGRASNNAGRRHFV